MRDNNITCFTVHYFIAHKSFFMSVCFIFVLVSKPFQCKKCKRAFVNQTSLEKHVKTHVAIKEFTCELCEAIYTSHAMLNTHMVTHATFKRFKCPCCDAHFKSHDDLEIHVGEHHVGPETHVSETNVEEGRPFTFLIIHYTNHVCY